MTEEKTPHLANEDRTAVPDLLRRASHGFGDRTALSLGDRRWSYATFQHLADRVARGLRDLGLEPGDRLAVMMPSHPTFPIVLFGALTIGVTVVSLNPLYAGGMVRHILHDSGARLLVTLDDAESIAKVQPFLEDGTLARVITCAADARDLVEAHGGGSSSTGLAALLDNDGRHDAVAIDPGSALAVLQYTGGTTGVPKGAMLTHANLVANAEQIRRWFPHLEDGRESIFIPLPFSHITGISVCMTLAVRLAAELIVLPRFTPLDALAILRKNRPTIFGGVPTIFTALLMTDAMTDADWTSVRGILCGGAPLTPSAMATFEKLSGNRIQQIYGSTELSPAATIMTTHADASPGSVGLPLEGTRIEIRSTADPSVRMREGEVGEIAVCGPQVMKGYWKQEEETRTHLLADGFFRTGDLGYLDEKGYLFLVDRLKDMIIAGGYNVYPTTIEKQVSAHPAVAETIVLGVPDAYRGETIKAFVTLRPGQSLTLEELQAFLKERLSPIELPRQLEIRETLPKTLVGKLSRLELKSEIARDSKKT